MEMVVQRHAIAVASVGTVPLVVLRSLMPNIESRFPGRVVRPAARDLPHPSYAHSAARSQYQVGPVLEQLVVLDETAERVLGVTDLDLYTPGLNFVFGEADPGGPAALISLARLRPEFWGRPPDADMLLTRTIKEAVHALGHTYGIGHCSDPTCVMFLSNTVAETDHKGDEFCARHRADLQQRLRPAA